MLPFIQPLIRPRGKNITDNAITPPSLLPPFLQLLSRSDTRLLSIVFVEALVKHILPALPHDPLDSAEYSINAGVPALIRILVPSAEYTSVSTTAFIAPASALLSALKFSVRRRTKGEPLSNKLLRLILYCAIASKGKHNIKVTISIPERICSHNLISFFICVCLLIGCCAILPLCRLDVVCTIANKNKSADFRHTPLGSPQA